MGVKQDSRFMKMFKVMAASMLGIAFCLGFTACSDDDENGNGNDGDNTTTVVNPEKVFTGGLPKSVSGMSISQNEEGLVTSITTDEGEKAVFEYFPVTRAEASINSARITVTDENGDVTELNLQLNSDGYVKYCKSIDHAGTPDADEFTWEMEYDTEGHLIEMRRSESDGELTKITYKDGDVVATSTQSFLDDGGKDINGDGKIDNQDIRPDTKIYYTTDEITIPIENKGCLMMFDELLDVDMDEMIYAYYGGMLGTATKHLPLRMHAPYAHDSQGFYFSDYDFKWTLNSNGYPTELIVKSHGEGTWEDRYSFAW